jgi:nitrate reductase NapAB chaperone NapD
LLQAAQSNCPGVEIHADTDDGRLIVTLECDNDVQAIELYKTIEHLSWGAVGGHDFSANRIQP